MFTIIKENKVYLPVQNSIRPRSQSHDSLHWLVKMSSRNMLKCCVHILAWSDSVGNLWTCLVQEIHNRWYVTSVYLAEGRPAGPTPLGGFGASVLGLRCSPLGTFGVWDGPASKAMGHAPRQARDWLVRSVRTRPSRSPAFTARADFLKVGHLAPFSQLLHIKGWNFLDVFFRSSLRMTPMNRKVSWKLVRTFFRNLEHRHTDAATLYIYRSNFYTDHVMDEDIKKHIPHGAMVLSSRK